MIKLRPHHILCARFYKSVGYSKDFVSNMDKVLFALKNDPSQTVEIVSDCDDICSSCPNNKKGCITRQKVEGYDGAVLKKLEINLKTAVWSELQKQAREKINTAGELFHICGDCEWFNICKEEIDKTKD